MQHKLRRLGERIDALNTRERMLLMLASLAAIFLLWDAFLMDPVRQRQAAVQIELEQVRERLAQLNTSIQILATRSDDDRNRELQVRRNTLEQELARLEQRLTEQFDAALSPRQAVATLAGLLEGQPGLTVVALENLPPQALVGADSDLATGVFVHRVRVSLEGDHAALRAYLERIPDLPGGVFLESMHLSVPGWPINRIELMFYSLTLDDSWLGV